MSDTSFSATTTHSVTVPIVKGGPTAGTTGTAITITGTDFNAFIPVKSLSIGGVQVEIPINMTTDVDGKFTPSGTVPKLESGAHPILVQVGDSTYTLTFTLQGGSSTTGTTELNTNPTIYQLTQDLSPLGANLMRVFHFDNGNKEWTFYDPNPEFAPFITLTELITGNAYCQRWEGGKPRSLATAT